MHPQIKVLPLPPGSPKHPLQSDTPAGLGRVRSHMYMFLAIIYVETLEPFKKTCLVLFCVFSQRFLETLLSLLFKRSPQKEMPLGNQLLRNMLPMHCQGSFAVVRVLVKQAMLQQLRISQSQLSLQILAGAAVSMVSKALSERLEGKHLPLCFDLL